MPVLDFVLLHGPRPIFQSCPCPALYSIHNGFHYLHNAHGFTQWAGGFCTTVRSRRPVHCALVRGLKRRPCENYYRQVTISSLIHEWRLDQNFNTNQLARHHFESPNLQVQIYPKVNLVSLYRIVVYFGGKLMCH